MIRNLYFWIIGLSFLAWVYKEHACTHVWITVCMHFVLSGGKKSIEFCKQERGWNQIRGLQAVTLCLIASLNRMSSPTCLDGSGQLVQTHECATAEKVMFRSGVCSLEVGVFYACCFHCENMQGRRQRACVCHYSTFHLCGSWCQWSCLPIPLICSLQLGVHGWGAYPSGWARTFSGLAWLLEFRFVAGFSDDLKLIEVGWQLY